MVPGVDEFDGPFKIVYSDDRQNWCENFPGMDVTVRRRNSQGSPSSSRSLAHQGIIRANVPNDRRSDIFRFTVCFSAENDSALGVIQHSLDPVKSSVIREASDGPRFGCAIRIKFLVTGQT